MPLWTVRVSYRAAATPRNKVIASLQKTVAPKADGRPLCCGRTYLAAGMVDRARAEAQRTLAALAGGQPVVGLEPSCPMTLRDEFGSLLPTRKAPR